MENILAAIMVPHPPIILPNIGHGEEKRIEDISKGYIEAAKAVADAKPETVVIISPHAPSYYDYIQISSGKNASGSLVQFGDYEDEFDIAYDEELIDEIERTADAHDLPAGTLGLQDGTLDHGTMVPLYFLQQQLPEDTKYVRISIGGPNNRLHYALGKAVAESAKKLGRKVAVVASGDLSHCQKVDSSYGFKACGPKYDKKIMKIMESKDFEALLDITDQEADEAMVCGQKPFCVLAGTMDGLDGKARNLGHSAEFGVGYGIVSYTDLEKDDSRHFLEAADEKSKDALAKRMEKEDSYVKLARSAVNACINSENTFEQPEDLPDELFTAKAGCFVSVHENGALRGCIGTTEPTQNSLAEEIVANAISAVTRDPRFPQVMPWELDDLEISVDVLNPPEPVESEDMLDPKKYGVIVSKGNRRGLLLPDLEGVDSIEQQIMIARQKAGIDEEEKGCSLMRFTVVRHT